MKIKSVLGKVSHRNANFLYIEHEYDKLENKLWFIKHNRTIKVLTGDEIQRGIDKSLYEDKSYSCSDGCRCKSLRAFRRFLKKHTYLPSGTQFRLVSHYVDGNDYIGRIK